MHNPIQVKHTKVIPTNIDHIQSNTIQCILNEVVIRMIIKSRSPIIKHVARTHTVALDWLFDRINLKAKSNSVTLTSNIQFADILTKGTFTRDEWNILLDLLNLCHLSSFRYQKFQFD